MKIALFLLAVLNVPSAAVVTYCYYKSPDHMNMMQNQSCITTKVHLNDNLISTDYNNSHTTIPVILDEKESEESHVQMCVVFRYIVKQNLSSAVSSRSSSLTFQCDFNHWCYKKKPGFHRNVTVAGHSGDLYCCDTDNCNTESVMPELPPPQICYKNTHHWGHHLQVGTGTLTLCKDPDAWCIRSRLLNATRPLTVYSCDNLHQCQYFNMTSGSSVVCRNVTKADGKEELCCCSGQSCFSPPTRSAASMFGSPIAEEQRGDANRGLSTVTIGCIVAFSLLALVGGLVMIGFMYQRQSLPDSSNLTLTYSRIEEDDLSDSIQML
ncbi:hypothetical protein V1264_014176 [Littorina saxatilis]